MRRARSTGSSPRCGERRRLAQGARVAGSHRPGGDSPGRGDAIGLRSLPKRWRRAEALLASEPFQQAVALLELVADLEPSSALRELFAKGVIGQPEAGECVVRVALIKAGLTDPTRPQAVLPFVGPTGTGTRRSR